MNFVTNNTIVEASEAGRRESGDLAIEVRNVTKNYRIWSSPEARFKSILMLAQARLLPEGNLRSRLVKRASSYYKEYPALNDVSFNAQRGAAIGIMGRNGAGKSTLLQIISGVLTPTTGMARCHGKVNALLELGSGFNPQFTGRENVYLNGAIMGLSRSDIDARFDDIAAFADIGDFMNQPIGIYSSGMKMRLAFAVQIATEPEILIIDEALAVGDAPFQAKCYRRLRQLLDDGLTLLFVSHTSGTVRSLCDQAIWLRNGTVEAYGSAEEVSDQYDKYCWSASGMDVRSSETTVASDRNDSAAAFNPIQQAAKQRFDDCAAIERQGDGSLHIDNFYLENSDGTIVDAVRYDEVISAVYHVHVDQDIDCDFEVGITIKDLQGSQIYSAVDFDHGTRLTCSAGSRIEMRMRFKMPLRAGKYSISTGLFGFVAGKKYADGVIDFSKSAILDRLGYACFFTVLPRKGHCLYGPVHADARLSVSLYCGREQQVS